MKDYMDENLSVIYDRAFIRLDNYNTNGPHYIPMVLKGAPGANMYFHQNLFRVRKQKDKHWFRLVPEGFFGYAFTKEELKAVIRNDTGIKHKAILSDGKELKRDEYADWFLKKLDEAQSFDEHFNNKNYLVVQLDDSSKLAYISEEHKFYNNLKGKFSEEFQLTFKDVMLHRPKPDGESFFVINLPPGVRFFQKLSSRRVFYSNYITGARKFQSETEVVRYIEKYSDRYFSSNGFEIFEYVKRNGQVEKVQ